MSHLEARGLIKIYNKRKVVNQIDLDISPGEVVGLLGPNGAGKTTTFYMIVGLVKPEMEIYDIRFRCINGLVELSSTGTVCFEALT